MYDEALKAYFSEHEEALKADVAELVAINSERMEAKENMPFGEGPARALAKGMEILQRAGLTVKNYDNYCITGDLDDKERRLDILAHLDVVPAGEGWTVTDPFVMKEENGAIYGRGTADDKGPAMCALYAMKAIRDLKIPLKYGVRLILGSDEECGSSDIAYYFTKEKSAPMSISPDADFPLIHLEKGGLQSGFTSDAAQEAVLPRVTRFWGGVKVNVIPPSAEAEVEGLSAEEIEKTAERITALTGVRFLCEKRTAQTVGIRAAGVNAHAAGPADGKNAVTGLLELLAALPLADTPVTKKLRAVSRMFPCGDYYGHALGVDLEDEVSGKTTLALTIFHMDEKEMSGMFDCRASILANDENTKDVIYRQFLENGLTPMDKDMYTYHYVKEDSELVQGLLKAYNEVTGKEGKPMAIGGGTYVHNIENGVAFGCAVPEVDNHMHGPDEFMLVGQMLDSCLILAKAIINLCG